MNIWREAIIDELVCCHIYTDSRHEDDPHTALSDAIHWNVSAALDPNVSYAAHKLHRSGFYLGLASGVMMGVGLGFLVGTMI